MKRKPPPSDERRDPIATLPDAEARRRIREDLDATLFVEAAAGTGKTTALVERIVSLLVAGRARLEGIVAVTFTDKAAGEMKLRLRAEIERARDASAGEEVRARLDAALGSLEVAHIETIHSFCADLLHRRPVEAGVDPLFQVAAGDEQERLLDEAFDAWFETVLADPPEGVRRVLRRRARGPDANGPRRELRLAAAALVEHRDFASPWRRDPFERDAAIDRVLDELAELAPLARQAGRADDWLGRNLAEVERFVQELALREEVHGGGGQGRDHDGLEAELRDFARSSRVHWHWRGAGSFYAPDLPRADVMARRDQVKAKLDELVRACDADLAPRLREELRPVLDGYEARKRRAGKLDFLDLLVRARDLVRDEPGVRRELQREYTHFFVDEFQDTDPLQAELLLLLAADDPGEGDWTRVRPVPGKLFVVGDPKQSIYRFRRADVAIYEATKERLRARGADVLHLVTSFRAVPSLQAAVNAAFAPAMEPAAGGSQAGYVPLAPFRPEAESRPSLVALPVPKPYGDFGRVVRWKIDESFPDAVGAFVEWLVAKSGWTVLERSREDGREEPVPLQPRHVCLLFRRFKRFRDDVTRPYVRALEVRRVPHVLIGGRSFHDREEVLAIRTALGAVERPDDELRVFATLRGPLFALGDDALLAFRHRQGRTHRLASLHPLRPLDPGALDASDREVADALAVLAGLHRRRNRRPIAETVAALLEAVRAHAGIAIWPTGEQALANCLRVVDLARRFERRGAPSFRAFVERLEDDAERGDVEEAPVVEEGTEGVRIMTVHKAKGLEFPVVILADPTCAATREPPTRHVDASHGSWLEALCGCAPPELVEHHESEARRDREEAVRLAYVAATRARDLLVVPVCGVGVGEGGGDAANPMQGWLSTLEPAVYPPRETRRKPRRAAFAGVPEFGRESLVDPPENARDGASVAPGLHRPRAGDHEVVWWDPHALELDREEQVGLRQQRILEADEGGSAAEEGIRAHERWQARRAEALAQGERPSLVVAPVTTLAAAASALEADDVSLLEVALERAGRPHGRRFGTLVHATLAAVRLGAGEDAVRATARAQGRLVGASPEEVEAAAVAAGAALAHPLLRAAAEAETRGELRREVPVILRLEDGSLAEGVVDLAFRASDEEARDGQGRARPRSEPQASGAIWTVVDFKTDQELGPQRARYTAQVCLYARAVAEATGEPARGVLLSV
jgi:ATP-dependent exoDNAse (exonuclease V) beta subunit